MDKTEECPEEIRNAKHYQYFIVNEAIDEAYRELDSSFFRVIVTTNI